MQRFEGWIAVVTGGGTAMGRELARQLVAEGGHVSLCDVSEEAMARTRALCEEGAPAGARVHAHRAEVSSDADVVAFRDAVAEEAQLEEARERIGRMGVPVERLSSEPLRQALQGFAEGFRDRAPLTAADAAAAILEGVRAERWRILLGEDAAVLDELVRESPEEAYEPAFLERLTARTRWGLGS